MDIPEKEELTNHLQKWDRGLDSSRRCYGIKVCLAGAESEKIRAGLYRIGVRRISVSYFYLRKWLKKRGTQEIGEEFGKFDYVFLTSGCDSLLQKNKHNKIMIEPQKYAEDYYKELKRVGHLFAGCTEIDLDSMSRDYLDSHLDILVDEGVPIVPVITGKPIKFYEDRGWFDTYSYLAVSSAVLSDKEYAGYRNDLYRLCRERSVLLHGLGVASTDVLLRSRLYSIGTSAWSNGAQFGTTHLFENGRLRYYPPDRKSIRSRYQKRFESAGLNWSAIKAERTFEVNLMNALAWRELADYHQYRAPNAYWLSPEERTKATELKAKSLEGLIDKEASMVRAEERRLALVDNSDEDGRVHEPLHCDLCNIQGNCPRYEPGESCSFDINVRLRNAGDLRKMMITLVEAQYSRALNGVLFEKVEGGAIDRNVSLELQRLVEMTAQMRNILSDKPTEKVKIEATSSKPGSLQHLLAGVFAPTGSGGSGSGNTQTQRATKTIDIEADSVDSIEDDA
jgi:predicted peroxiredoxin